jgi:hypothetical protein
VPVVVTQPDRESFRRCRRQWDLQARMRRNLEPVTPAAGPDPAAAVRAALAVYYFPGMWDWDRNITMPLVLQAFDRERERGHSGATAPAWPQHHAVGHDLLHRYADWARGVDRFSPVLIDSDYDVLVLDADRPESGLTGPDGQPVRFRGRIDMLAVDEYDAYWLVRHTVRTGAGLDAAGLASDEAALADAWAWEQFYPGMVIAGTVYNELLIDATGSEPPAQPDAPTAAAPNRRGRRRSWLRHRAGVAAGRSGPASPPLVRQHEPSGGGRSIPQHRRMDARAREPVAAGTTGTAAPVSTVQEISASAQSAAGGFRRVWVRHSPAAVAAAGRRLAADTVAMLEAAQAAAASPSDANCRPCAFLEPCLAMRAGRDSDFMLRSGYRPRPPDTLEEGRLGGSSWSAGRGAAPLRRRG